MNKRQWFLVAGTLVLAACGTGTGVCETPGFSHGENRGRDEVAFVECSDPQTSRPAEAPAPKVNQPADNQP